jgi:hypothetical protein
MSNNQIIELTFKKVYTNKSVCYNIDANFTMKEFINYIKSKAYNDFNINDNYKIEIVEAGQFNNINGSDAELAPEIESCETTLREKYGEKYKYVSFYIRPKLNIQIPEINSNNIYNNNIPATPRAK